MDFLVRLRFGWPAIIIPKFMNTEPDPIASDTKSLNRLVCEHTGMFGFKYLSKDFLNLKKSCIVFQHAAKRHLIRIERNNNKCNFYRASPGIGTKIVSLDLTPIAHEVCEDFQLLFSWSPMEMSAGIIMSTGKDIGGKAEESQKGLKVGRNNEIFEIGNVGVEVMGATMILDNQIVVEPTALEQWQEIQKATNHLLGHEPDKDFLYETIVCGQALSMIVTGFENFLKRRFIELEEEGVKVDNDTLIKRFCSKAEKEKDLPSVYLQEAKDHGSSLAAYLVAKRVINFQSMDNAKKAYKAAYKLIFGNIMENTLIDSIEKYLRYRHRIVHISPIQTPLNLSEFQQNRETPVFATQETIRNAFYDFGEFISTLNQATLYLMRQP